MVAIGKSVKRPEEKSIGKESLIKLRKAIKMDIEWGLYGKK